MEIKEVTTLQDLPNDSIVDGRRMGNTTRVVDHAIQLLFKGYKIHVLDHWQNGRHEHANKDLFARIIDRLHFEHNIKGKDDLLLDNKALTIMIRSYSKEKN